MKTLEVTTISSKGQVVIPTDIREEMHLSSGTKLMVMTDGFNLLLKPIETPKIELFQELIKKSREYAKTIKLSKPTVSKALKKIRHESRA